MGVTFIPTDKQLKACVFCSDNDIKLYPKPVSRGIKNKLWYICVTLPGKAEACGNDEYNYDELWPKMYEYYEFYYDKFKDSTL